MSVSYIFSWSNNILSSLGLYNDKTFHVPIFKSFSLICCRELDHPDFTSLELATIFFSFCEARSSALHLTPILGGQVTAFMSPSERAAPLYPQASDSLVAYRLLQLGGLQWRYSKPPPYETFHESQIKTELIRSYKYICRPFFIHVSHKTNLA
jgi:hypothetical protein